MSTATLSPPTDVLTSESVTRMKTWTYPASTSGRDLRIDLLRGLAIMSLVVNHLEIFSIFNLATWERVGVVSGAEGFVALAGFVLGAVHRKRISEKGWAQSAQTLVDRALELYRVNVIAIVTIGLLAFMPFLNLREAMTFSDRGAGVTYPLYPTPGTPWHTIIAKILMLQAGPHQIQILGLYTVLLFAAPLVLWLLTKNRVALVLGASWTLYMANWAFPVMPTGTQFEYGFPVLAWQLIFFHGMIFGYYKKELAALFTPLRKRVLLTVSYVLFAGFLFFTWNNPYPSLPPWMKISVIRAATFNWYYTAYFLKNPQGILRVLNFAVAVVVAYHLLTISWRVVNKAIGWFFIPLGQASLYVFILHTFVVQTIYNIPLFAKLQPDYRSGNIWLNTAAHASALMALWLLVRYKVAFKWIPR